MVAVEAEPWAGEVDETISQALDRRFQDGRLSAEIILQEFEASAALITISRRRAIIAKDRDTAADQFATIIATLRAVDTKLPSISHGNKRLLSWVVDAGRDQADKEASASFDLLRHVFKSLQSDRDLASWLADRATVFAANVNRSWLPKATLAAACPPKTFGTAVRAPADFFGHFKGDSWSRFPTATAFVRLKSGQGPQVAHFSYFSHAAPPENNWNHGARGEQRIARSGRRDEWLTLFYEASLQHLGRLHSSMNQAPASKLFKAGFLTLSFDGLVSLP